MKWIARFVFIGLMLVIGRSFASEQLPPEPIVREEPEEDVLLKAVMYVESNYNPEAINHGENAVGVLQIRPIAVREANRILALQGSDQRFHLDDRTDSLKSIQIWYTIQEYHNPEYDPLRAAKIWNGRRMPQKYWMKVENELNKLK